MVLALTLHVLAATIWVGGMFFAYVCLRPSVPAIEPPPERLRLWRRVFARFFPWVWISILLLLGSGLWIIFSFYGGMAGVRPHVHMMLGLGVLMMLLYAHLFFAPWKRFARAVDGDDLETAGRHLAGIRRIVSINLVLGLINTVIGSTGKYWAS